jgi:hypothetical protein
VLVGQLVAAVERKSLADLVASLIGGKLRYQVADLAALPPSSWKTATRRCSSSIASVRPAVVTDGLAELQVCWPNVSRRFARRAIVELMAKSHRKSENLLRYFKPSPAFMRGIIEPPRAGSRPPLTRRVARRESRTTVNEAARKSSREQTFCCLGELPRQSAESYPA